MALTRRQVWIGAGGGAAALAAGYAGWSVMRDGGYAEAVDRTWRAADLTAEGQAARAEMVRCATLAANSHNTQPWRFAVGPDAIVILPDGTRRTPVVDPDDHHLHVSLGCAAANLALAARAFGYGRDAAFDGSVVRLAFEPGAPEEGPLFQAIPARQSARSLYDGTPVAAAMLDLLAATASDGVELRLLTDRRQIDAVRDLLLAANAAQLRDPAFRAELKQWVRFSKAEAAATGDGLFSGATGNPSIPRWLGSLIFEQVLDVGSENDKLAAQLAGSAGLAVIAAASDDPQGWVAAGRVSQRFQLQATSLGLSTAFLNQAVEVPTQRAELAGLLGLGTRRPDLVLRFGHGSAMPRSLRRPVEAVISA